MIKIGYDAKRAVANFTGIGNYSRLLLRGVADALPDAMLELYAPYMRDNPRLAPLLALPNVRIRLPERLWRRFGALWRSRGICRTLRRDALTLYHGLSNELPVGIERTGIPSVVTIHDVIFRRIPHVYKPVDRRIYDYKFRRAALCATRVIAISERTKLDLVELYGADPGRIDVVYQGCDAQFHAPVAPAEIARVRARYGLDRPYIVGVGTVEERKNQLLTLQALRALPADVDAVIVGRRTPYARTLDAFIAANGLAGRVRFIESAPFADLPPLYAGALLSSYPSRYEGFGIPVIESLAAGTPVIVATGSCLEEAAGPEAPAVGPDDADAFIDAARAIIDDPARRRALVDAGRSHIRRFSAQRFTDATLLTYARATDGAIAPPKTLTQL